MFHGGISVIRQYVIHIVYHQINSPFTLHWWEWVMSLTGWVPQRECTYKCTGLIVWYNQWYRSSVHMCFLLATLMVQRFECVRLTELCANIDHFTISLIDTIRCPPYRWCILWLHMVCIIHASSECVLMLNEWCRSVAPCAQYSMDCAALGDSCLRCFNARYHKEDLIWTKTAVIIHLLSWGASFLATSPF
jgi:hypothetical protein